MQTVQRLPLAAMTWQDRLFLWMVAVLPLHTVFLSAWISWKPFLVLLTVIGLGDLRAAVRDREWPYHRAVTLALLPLIGVIAVGFPVVEFRERFLRLTLAVAVGALVMLVTERRLRSDGLPSRLFRTVFWSAAVMGATGVLFSLVSVGAFGGDLIATVNDVPGLFRVSKPAYLETGFLALTNWHQDPGYGAAWAVLWSMLALVASLHGEGSGSWVFDSVVVGGVWLGVVMAFSRTGWLSLVLACVIVTAGLWRAGVSIRSVTKRIVVGALATVMLLAGVWALDQPDVGGDLELQFAFRLSQGWDLLADLTGLFSTSDEFADRFEPSEERADVWPEYLEMFRENPVFGVGLSVGWQTNSIGQEPHNLVIELLAETGVLGLLAFLLLLGVIVRSGRGSVTGALLVVTFLPSITQTVLFEPTWWFAAGLYLAGADN